MPSMQQLRQRMRSAEVTGKITRAMRTVASAKLRVFRAERARVSAFFNEYYAIIGAILASARESASKRDKTPADGPVLYALTGSAMGLCGPHNTNMNKLLLERIRPGDKIYVMGRKAAAFWKSRNMGDAIIAVRGVSDADVNFDVSMALGEELMRHFAEGKFARVCCVYSKSVNAMTQAPQVMQLMPLDREFVKSHAPDPDDLPAAPIEFEPDAESVIRGLAPQFLQVALYGCLIESKVAEYASRQATMDGATHNADKLRDEYLLAYNQLRQAKITQEITEIVQAAPEAQ